MKRILFLAADLCSGGAERQMVTIARLLKDKGYDVAVYCYDKADFYAHILRESKIPIVWDLEPTNHLKRMIKVRRFIRRRQFDIVISFLPTCNFLNDFAAIGGKKWSVITGVRSAYEKFFESKRGILFSRFQKYSDYIVCNSENAKKMWLKYIPDHKQKLKVIYNTVSLPQITSSYNPKQYGKLHIIVAATYQYLKNPIGLIKSILLMSQEEKELVVIDWYGRPEISRGNTEVFDLMSKMITENHLESIIRLHKDTSDIADLMNKADVVMLLSHFEGLPNVICEGMALGKPIIMSRVSDYSTLVTDANGHLCDYDNYESIKTAILYMAQLPIDILIEMGHESLLRASHLFSTETIVSQWIQLIES